MEGEVGRFRRRHLVPVPRVQSLAELNALLEAADRSDDARHIAGRLATVGQMAEAERPALRPSPPRPSTPRSRCKRRPTARRASRCAARATRCRRPTRAARWRCASAAGPSPPSPRAGWSPAMSAARTGGPRSSCSTISSRCCHASPAPCPARSRSSRRAPRGASAPRTNASGSVPGAVSVTARGRGRSSRCCCCTAICPSSPCTPRSMRWSESARWTRRWSPSRRAAAPPAAARPRSWSGRR